MYSSDKSNNSIDWHLQIETYPEARLDVLVGRHLSEASLEEDLSTKNTILAPTSISKLHELMSKEYSPLTGIHVASC